VEKIDKAFPFSGKPRQIIIYKTHTKSMSPQDIQKQIFALIEHKIKPRKLSAVLPEVLNLATSAVYRRLTGETFLNFEQLILLMTRFDISFEHLTDPSLVSFHLPSLKTPPKNIYEYLWGSKQNLEALTQSPKSLLRYAAVEIPFYYYLAFPHLAAFKFYMWGRTLWHSNRGSFSKFNFEEYTKDAPLQALMKKMVALNNQVETEEIWNDYMLDITYNQIRYCYKTGLIEDAAVVKTLLNDIRNLIGYLESVAETGRKTADGESASVQVWDNELFQNPMLVLAETPTQHLLYSNIDVPYFMVSQNTDMYQVASNFINRIQSFSNDLTNANEMNRHNYFKRLHQKAALYEEEINRKHVLMNGFTEVA
jgi:hypothetical protein